LLGCRAETCSYTTDANDLGPFSLSRDVPVNSSAHSAVFDRQAALERMGFDKQLYEEMVRLLLEDCPRRLAELKAAVEARNLELAKHAAHSLKGLAANFSANGAVRTAAAIERDALDGRWDQIAAKTSQLLADFEAFLQAVRRDAVRENSPGTAGSSRSS
jgi:HPt (histidine-containing phosphotransfer) domain-containing protein